MADTCRWLPFRTAQRRSLYIDPRLSIATRVDEALATQAEKMQRLPKPPTRIHLHGLLDEPIVVEADASSVTPSGLLDWAFAQEGMKERQRTRFVLAEMDGMFYDLHRPIFETDAYPSDLHIRYVGFDEEAGRDVRDNYPSRDGSISFPPL